MLASPLAAAQNARKGCLNFYTLRRRQSMARRGCGSRFTAAVARVVNLIQTGNFYAGLDRRRGLALTLRESKTANQGAVMKGFRIRSNDAGVGLNERSAGAAWRISLGLSAVLLAATAHAQRGDPVCRVAVDGLAANDGASWSTPKDLHGALADTGCAELWLKQGVYRPSTPMSVPASDRTRSFRLSRDLTLYGGFVGSETLRSQRDAAINRTILSGDIGGDDLNADGNFIAEVAYGGSGGQGDIVGNNSYHVLLLGGVGGASITPATVIDGITVTAGQANTPLASYEAYGGGLFCHAAGTGSECSPTLIDVDFHGNLAGEIGGAMCNQASGNDSISSPTLIRVRFGGNQARLGGGMSNMPSGQNNSEGGVNRASPTLLDVSFVGNRARQGGAMYNQPAAEHSHTKPTLERVTFSDNHATTYGGAMAHASAGDGAVNSPVLRQVTLSGNSAFNGGAMSFRDGNSYFIMAPVLEHVTFFANNATAGGGGAVFIQQIAPQPEIHVTLTHTILSQNTAATAGHQIYALGAVSVSMANSLIEGGCMAGSGISINNGAALNCGAGNVSGDALLGPLQANGGFTLSHLPGLGSAAIDTGDNTLCAASDQRGALRPQDGDGNGSAICDIGSVEVGLLPPDDDIFASGFEAGETRN